MNYNTECPDYMVGNCKGYDKCFYKLHYRCDTNYLCDKELCKKGHGISLIKRQFVTEIYNNNFNIKYEDSENKCEHPLLCYDTNCMKTHYIDIIYRNNIKNIIKCKTDDEAIDKFNSTKKNVKRESIKEISWVAATTVKQNIYENLDNDVNDIYENLDNEFVDNESTIEMDELLQNEKIKKDKQNELNLVSKHITDSLIEIKNIEIKINELINNKDFHSKSIEKNKQLSKNILKDISNLLI